MTHYTCKFTVETWRNGRQTSIGAFEGRLAAIKHSIKRMRRGSCNVKIFHNDHLIWERG